MTPYNLEIEIDPWYKTTASTSTAITLPYNATLKYKYSDNSYSIITEGTCATTLGSSYKQLKFGIKSCDWSTSTSTDYSVVYGDWFICNRNHQRLQTPSDKLREIIQSRQSPVILGTRSSLKPVDPQIDPREFRARETLLRVLGDDKFKKFLKDGFISVRARSGLVYQIFPGHGITNVYEDGEHVERLCVVLKGNFPPTDSLIMRYLLILNDENDFKKHAIEHTVIKKRVERKQILTFEPLSDLWDKLKQGKSVNRRSIAC